MKRECGSCTLCCKLIGVEELKKPQNVWCRHCNIGQGCKIYDTRPQGCRDFSCLWLKGLIPEELKPNDVHHVFDMTLDGKRLVVHSDPDRQHRQRIVEDFMEKVAQAGVDVILIKGDKRSLLSYNPETLKMLENLK